MRKLFIAIATMGMGATAHASVIGTTYTDATSDLLNSSLTNIDLVSARFSNDTTHLHLSLQTSTHGITILQLTPAHTTAPHLQSHGHLALH
ncbi:MAG: hypothetical protein CMJ27_06205 [Phycisphaerae bacterium]|nr:hypothetical protein [Phycisphaerae bacterium]